MKRLYKSLDVFVYYFKNELKLIFKDAGAVLLFLIAPAIYPLLYSIAYEKEVIKDIPVAVVDLDNSSLSRRVSNMIDGNELLKVVCKSQNFAEAKQLFFQNKVKGVLLIPDKFEKNILSGKQSDVVVYCDAGYFLLYKQLYTGSMYTIGTLNAGIEIKQMISEGKTYKQSLIQQEPIKVNSVYLYNPSGGYASFVIPGIIIIILQQTLLIGIGMLGGTLREKNIFYTMHNSIINQWGSAFVVLGKSFAYVIIYLFNSIVTMILLQNFLKLPDNSNVYETIFILIPFLFATAFLGITISVFFRERVYSLLFMVFLSPIVLFLSGLSWPASSIPEWLYYVAHIIPSTSMLPAYIKIRITGASIYQVFDEWVILTVLMLVYFVSACFAYTYAMNHYKRKTV
jgi:ABC-2 type transport system permease protein